MDSIPFVKYHGAGNDFIMIDDLDGLRGGNMGTAWIAQACHRRYGIGADGLILLQKGGKGADFYMKYYNADGRESTFCGNGARCIVAFARSLNVHQGKCRFLGNDGWHHGEVLDNGLVRISMSDVHAIHELDASTLTLDTGSPHFVRRVDDVDVLDVFREGKSIRNSPLFQEEGINVNFIRFTLPGELSIRTYERGVEDETYACGTGVVAAAIASTYLSGETTNSWLVHAKGGDLTVDFQQVDKKEYCKVFLTGPAEEVFSGELSL